MKKKLLALCGAVLMVTVFILSGCSDKGASSYKDPVTVAVKIVSTEKTVLEEEVTLEKEDATAGAAVMQACQNKKLAYTKDQGMYDGFDGITSTQTDGWLLYVNDELAEKGADEQTVAEGDVVIFQYVNYDEAFAS